ncbi:uncharacterized protein UV8b_01053 [Ustilaginoidea virens]|uniref:Palmitoyl-protein thioesterase 1 n=1 Tax=Ustilaginoidea virens TaxID=1159556 RepID=A0A063C1M9_USTVR|nr:uncharacterized protein UV8b_01053 [Ustilaginoidea virens]QUC16812.1 hypothetical protein UV8b_01053 [Ustilaginoidea virens]GAO19993.1 hypothetical protein UVI_02053340 [Ustilaginoidea virens]
MRASLVALGSSLAATCARPQDSDNPLPLVIWHGLGDAASSEGLAEISQLADAVAPGIFVHVVNPTAGGGDDRTATLFGNVSAQVEAVCAQLARHPVLSTAPAIDAVGFSQGGQFLRGYVERCNSPRVRNLITFGSQHGGITRFRECGPADYLCRAAMALLRFNVWSSFVQSRLVPAQYYRPADAAELQDYLDGSAYLADVNNERQLKNEAYGKNLASLDHFVMYLFENDTVSIPKESSWFGEVSGDGRYTPLRERAMYKEDWLGLRALDKKGGLKFRSVAGEHMHIPKQVLNDTLSEFLGVYKGKRTGGLAGFESGEL